MIKLKVLFITAVLLGMNSVFAEPNIQNQLVTKLQKLKKERAETLHVLNKTPQYILIQTADGLKAINQHESLINSLLLLTQNIHQLEKILGLGSTAEVKVQKTSKSPII